MRTALLLTMFCFACAAPASQQPAGGASGPQAATAQDVKNADRSEAKLREQQLTERVQRAEENAAKVEAENAALRGEIQECKEATFNTKSAKASVAVSEPEGPNFWCFGAAPVNGYPCYKTKSLCEQRSAQLEKDGFAPTTSCTAQSRAACYSFRDTLQQKTRVECQATSAKCRFYRDILKKAPGSSSDYSKITKCKGYAPDELANSQ